MKNYLAWDGIISKDDAISISKLTTEDFLLLEKQRKSRALKYFIFNLLVVVSIITYLCIQIQTESRRAVNGYILFVLFIFMVSCAVSLSNLFSTPATTPLSKDRSNYGNIDADGNRPVFKSGCQSAVELFKRSEHYQDIANFKNNILSQPREFTILDFKALAFLEVELIKKVPPDYCKDLHLA